MDEDEKREIREAFEGAVNMSPWALEEWLETQESREVGWTREGEDEAVGHKSGRRIAELHRTRLRELTDEDYAHMRKVVGYVRRQTAQGGPAEDKAHSRWRYSLMGARSVEVGGLAAGEAAA